MSEAPYKVTPCFDEETLPEGLRRVHSTKAGTWGLLRVIEGRVLLTFEPGGEAEMLTPDRPGLIAPERPHRVTAEGPFRMRVEFFRAPPAI